MIISSREEEICIIYLKFRKSNKKNQSNTPKYKIIECYICKNRAWKILIEIVSLLEGTNFLQKISENKLDIIPLSQNNYIFPCITWACNVSMSSPQKVSSQ